MFTEEGDYYLPNPIIDEIRRFREEHAASFNYDMKAIGDDIRKRAKKAREEMIARGVMPGPIVSQPLKQRAGYTLIEIMISVSLMMILMLAMSQVFARVGTEINNTQSLMQSAGRLRSAAMTLHRDLTMLSVDTSKAPPVSFGDGKGYFCYIEGNNDKTGNAVDELGGTDNTVGDLDDILMFTAIAPPESPFRGKVGGTVEQSSAAEIIYFVRGNTLYRRTLLILPDTQLQAATPSPANPGFYGNFDVSARASSGTSVVANTLDDLTQRENRFAHTGLTTPPYNLHSAINMYFLGMPLLEETAQTSWSLANPATGQLALTGTLSRTAQADFWTAPTTWSGVSGIDPLTGVVGTTGGNRSGEDVLLTNVISFDVKAWDNDQGVQAFVDLGSGTDFGSMNPNFNGWGTLSYVYDTWTDAYERDGSGGVVGPGLDQIDDLTNGTAGVIDDIGEWDFPPPYDKPLKGLQIQIRTFDPSSKHIRQSTVVVDLTKKR